MRLPRTRGTTSFNPARADVWERRQAPPDDPHLFDAFCLLLLCGLRVHYSSSRWSMWSSKLRTTTPARAPSAAAQTPTAPSAIAHPRSSSRRARWRLSRCGRGSPPSRRRARASRVSSPRLPRHPRRAGRVALHPPRDRRARILSRAAPCRRSAIVPVGRPRDALVVPASRAVVNAAADDAPDAPVSPFPELEATKASDAGVPRRCARTPPAPPSRSPSSSPPQPPSSPRTSARFLSRTSPARRLGR